MSSQVWDYIVVGGGFAGCSAAVELTRLGKRVCLLEAGPRLGGRGSTFEESKYGVECDLGQHVFLKAYDKTFELLKTLGVEEEIFFPERLDLPFFDVNARRTYSLKSYDLPPPMHLVAGLALFRHLTLKDRLKTLWGARKILDFKNIAPEWDRIPASKWLRVELQQPERVLKAFWEPLVLATLNLPLERASTYLLMQVLQQGFFRSFKDARIGFSRVPLRQLLEPFVSTYLSTHGSEVKLRTRALEFLSEREVRTAEENLKAREKIVFATNFPSLQKCGILKDIGQLESDGIGNVHLWMPEGWVWPWGEQIQMGFLGTTLQWLFCPAAIPGSKAPANYVTGTISASAEFYQNRSVDEMKDKVLQELRWIHPRFEKVETLRLMTEKRATFSSQVGQWYRRQELLAKIDDSGHHVIGDWTHRSLPSTIEAACQSGYDLAATCRL